MMVEELAVGGLALVLDLEASQVCRTWADLPRRLCQ